MNSLVALPIAAAIPTAAPAMDFPLAPVSVPPLPAADRELVELAKQLVEAVAESRRLNLIVDAMDGDRWVAPPASRPR